MYECMRWFGPDDGVSLSEIRQCGATGIVTALHEVPVDEVWTAEAVTARREMIEAAGLSWAVAESIPVHDAIKRGDDNDGRYLEIWIESLKALAAGGVPVVCYNFMPVLDWTRTDLDHPLPSGATSLRFDATAFAAFDIHILKRPGAEKDFDETRRAKAAKYFESLDQAQADRLKSSIIAGLPGGMSGSHDLDGLREALARYQGVDHATLLNNIIEFQKVASKEAETLGVKLAIHPDDPPKPLMGLPRAASTPADYKAMFTQAPSPANGLTWCLGSLSAGPLDAAMDIGRTHADRIYFSHLRVVEHDKDDFESFQEAPHLEGDLSLIEVLTILQDEQRRRIQKGDSVEIPVRPDHGHRMLDDLKRDSNPGYGVVGRLRGMSELRGAAAVLEMNANRKTA